jgi:hypothetical protein
MRPVAQFRFIRSIEMPDFPVRPPLNLRLCPIPRTSLAEPAGLSDQLARSLLDLRHVDAAGKSPGTGRRFPSGWQDAIASQILASLADEDAWKKRFAEKRDVIHRMALETLEEEGPRSTL